MNLQNIEFNNYDEFKEPIDNKLIMSALNTSDDYLINKLNNKILTKYQAKLNLINYVLNNLLQKNSFNTIIDIKNFFNMLSPLSNYYKLGSFKYNYKINEDLFYVQNSISKEHISYEFDNFVNTIKKNFENLEFLFFDLKNERFNKTTDILYVFKINGNNLIKK